MQKYCNLIWDFCNTIKIYNQLLLLEINISLFIFFAGASFGGLASYSATQDKFKPVAQILRDELSTSQKERLALHIQRVLNDLDIHDAVNLFITLQRSDKLVVTIFCVLKQFLESDLLLKVVSDWFFGVEICYVSSF